MWYISNNVFLTGMSDKVYIFYWQKKNAYVRKSNYAMNLWCKLARETYDAPKNWLFFSLLMMRLHDAWDLLYQDWGSGGEKKSPLSS